MSHRRALAEAARRIVEQQAALGPAPPQRVVETAGPKACMVLVWDAAERMPTAKSAARPAPKGDGGREECRAVILDVIGGAGVPMPAKEVIGELRRAGLIYGAGTVVKALADLTAAGQLVNPRDRRGYRLPEWGRPDVAPTFA